MEVWQKEALLRHRMAILDDLHVDYVMDYLLARQVLLEEHKESIFTQHGRRNRARHLLDILPSLGPSAYEEFIASLRDPYSWLADILSKESAKTATNVASTSQYVVPSTAQNQQPLPLSAGEINQLLLSLASVASTCGKSLCAIGDAVMTIVQSMKTPGSHQLPNALVSRQNSINLAKNGQQVQEDSRQITMDRLRGGGDGNEHKNVVPNTEKIEVPPSSLPLPNDSLEVDEKNLSKNVDVDPEKIEGIETVEKIIDSAYIYGDSVDGVYPDEIIREENSSDVLKNLMRNKIDGVGCFRDNVEQYKTSRAEDELYNDTPDSGIARDEVMGQIGEGMSSLVIVQQNGVPDGAEDDFENSEDAKGDSKSDEADDSLMTPSGSSQWMSNKDSDRSLNPVLCEMQTLQRSLSDMTVALRTIVQISERAFKIASSIQN